MYQAIVDSPVVRLRLRGGTRERSAASWAEHGTAKGMCINNCFAMAEQCDTVRLWSAALVQCRVYGNVTTDFHPF
jgi:hypothetical protein